MYRAGVFAEAHNLGIVLSYVGVMLSIHDIVVPDLVFYTHEQWSSQHNDEYCEGSPAMIGEVMSEVTRRRDLVRKRALYARSGIAEYWLLDPDLKSVAIEELVDGGYRPRAKKNGRVTSRVLDGFVLDADEVFRQLRKLEAIWTEQERKVAKRATSAKKEAASAERP